MLNKFYVLELIGTSELLDSWTVTVVRNLNTRKHTQLSGKWTFLSSDESESPRQSGPLERDQ
jgi:hypothetical protein